MSVRDQRTGFGFRRNDMHHQTGTAWKTIAQLSKASSGYLIFPLNHCPDQVRYTDEKDSKYRFRFPTEICDILLAVLSRLLFLWL